MFKEKLLAQLVIKFPGVSKKFLGLWADKLQSKVTEESQIPGVIDALDNLPIPITDLATEFQKEGDDRVDEAKNKWLKNPPKPANPKPPKTEEQTPPAETKIPEDAPEWAKGLLGTVQTMAQTITGLQKEKTQQTISQKIASHEKIKGISAAFWNKRALPESEEGIDAFAEDVAKDYGTFVQESKDKGLSIITPPGGGTHTEKQSTAVDPAIKQFAEKTLVPQNGKTVTT